MTRVTPRRGAALAAGLAVVVLLGGCGSDDDPSTWPSRYLTPSSSSSVRPSVPTVRSTPPSLPPPYIERVEWAQTEVGPSLQIHPTPAGRKVEGDDVEDTAWREVLALDPSADTPGMRAQFDCHWRFARVVDPDKTSWNLEPARPVVTEEEMISARCNPGFAEE
ncbi:MAG: DUF2599 domain-containing protein [Gordonia sp. (in: high G+C Gram-positive bacteria)]|uniref:DUF2599 domain-containing protein n=1 Tax=Gordonia sp. (in: high G+C Gram-positive bacteria) TaxID=84139 RepID=UPI0039E4EC73